jgi:DNA-binding NarL/FixJ family response regulator
VAPAVAGAVLRSIRTNSAGRAEPKTHAVPPLSPREGDVLGLLTRGCDNGDIARQLFVSPSTVKHHVSSLLLKIGAGNRVQAATFAVRTGLHDGCDQSA